GLDANGKHTNWTVKELRAEVFRIKHAPTPPTDEGCTMPILTDSKKAAQAPMNLSRHAGLTHAVSMYATWPDTEQRRPATQDGACLEAIPIHQFGTRSFVMRMARPFSRYSRPQSSGQL